MKIEANVWQKVPGATAIEIFPIIPKANCVSSNCYIFSAPDALVVVDPGARPEQTRQINRILTDALAVSHRPILVFLTHCHQDHSQEAGGLELPAGIEIKRFAHQVGVDAMKNRDPNLTVNYLYPGNPGICTARFEGILFASSPASEPPAIELTDGGRIELHTEPLSMPAIGSRSITLPAIPLAAYRYESGPCLCLVICPLPLTLGCVASMAGTMQIYCKPCAKWIGSWKRPSLLCVASGMVTAFRRKACGRSSG